MHSFLIAASFVTMVLAPCVVTMLSNDAGEAEA